MKPAPTYERAIAELGDLLALGVVSIPAADRKDFLLMNFESARVGLERRDDWTAAQRAQALADLGDSVARRLSTIVDTIGRA